MCKSLIMLGFTAKRARSSQEGACMANQDLLTLLRQGSKAWNQWKGAHPQPQPDLSYADLRRIDLHRADLHRADLHRADLQQANLQRVDLHQANLCDADLPQADLRQANLHKADLAGP